jgi:hypothetical protein
MIVSDRISRARLAGATVLEGHAYQHPATLEVLGDALTWRALRGALAPVAENIVTTIHEVRDARWIDQRWSLTGALLGALAIAWLVTGTPVWGAGSLAIAIGLVAWRRRHPRLFLVLELADRQLVMRIAGASAEPGRALVARIDHARETGEQPAAPPTLP